VRGHRWLKLAVVAALALVGATTAWTAAGRQAATPITGVEPAWSPNGRQIAFADLDGSWGIYVVNSDGSGRRRLWTGSRVQTHAISWAPDGSRVAFDATIGDDPSTVYTVPAAGGNPSRVTTGWSPAWGPNNQILVTDASIGEFGQDIRLYAVNADGGNRRSFVDCPQLDFGEPCGDENPSWSRDGRRVAFDMNIDGRASAVAYMNADGSGRRELTSYSPPNLSPTWSPEGNALVYEQQSITRQATKDVLGIMNIDGTGGRVLVQNARQPSWSPDGRTIIFSRSEGVAPTLYLVNADGSDVRQFTGTGTPTTTTGGAPATKCVVPKVVGKTLAAAKKLLTKAHCKTGKVTRVKSAKVAKGKVVSAKPKAGTSKPSGAAVALAVSRGKK
jgi:Tol biopolymer transport system component